MHPIVKNSYLQTQVGSINPRILNRCVDRARDFTFIPDAYDFEPPYYRLTSAQPNIPVDHVDVTRRPTAFGNWALPLLRRQLHDEDQTVVLASLTSLCDLLRDPEKAYVAIELHIPARLSDLLLESMAPVRERAVLALAIIAESYQGKEAIVSNSEILENLKLCLVDSQTSVRIKAAECVRIVAETWMTADVLVEFEFIEDILEYVQREVEDILEIHLESLKSLMYACGKCVALKNDAFKILMNLLGHENSAVVCRALDCLAVLTSTPKGKTLAIERNLLSTLNKLLHYGDNHVCTSAAAVLMFSTIKTKAKVLAAADLKTLPKRLVTLATSFANPTLQMYSIKALTNICEHPSVRKEVREHYSQELEDLQVTDEEMVEHKNYLLRVVNWCPEKHD